MQPKTVFGDVDVEPVEHFDDPRNPRPPELIDALASTKILTERQAAIFVYRDLEGQSRHQVAEHYGYSDPSSVDSVHQTAKQNLRDAERVRQLIGAYQSPPIPDRCDECGATLGSSWVGDEQGRALCFDCAGVDRDDALPSK